MDREKVIKGLEERIKVAEECMGNPMFTPDAIRTIIAMLKEQETQKFFVDESGKITPLPVVVRCKDCKHKEESVSPSWEAWCNRLHCGCDFDWFCADGERRTE